ncbi:Acg family FMN-binding oxidoreductase [Mycobacterium angelicum]|uniref:NAD(P)H nitroreductase n=1 Tax=Mycobacterium angelicum TaxID=470074 RepID=A0A1W9ZL87_MYCAN|nr:NAD(P)H nitroreductase [Mycobacterium angelicum]MCV7196452.1 NAD(P)H nitroreductase [Mycobacterium angelicum]ORA17668.1 NAD(P)H nitroreductase [Mycobacterium angelicum]
MESYFPDDETIRSVLTLATRAPSVYNTQPWRWRVDDQALHLYADPSRQLPVTDPDGRDLIVSCGAALNHCVIALAAMGWRSKVRRLPDPADHDHLATIEVHADAADPVDVALAAAIPQRRTDRRYYGSWPVSAADIALMGARAARLGVMLRQVDELATLKHIVTHAVRTHMSDREYLNELTVWSGRYDSKAGVPAHNTPAHDCASPLPGRFFAGPALAQPAGASPTDDKAAILALGTSTDDRLDWLRAGEATSVVLLTATALGLASCAVTEPLEIAATREAVRTDVFGSCCNPQMLLRVGWAPVNADPLPATPRRRLERAVEWATEDDQSAEASLR